VTPADEFYDNGDISLRYVPHEQLPHGGRDGSDEWAAGNGG
jgi:hypothetical protein